MVLTWIEGLSVHCSAGTLFQGACRSVAEGGGAASVADAVACGPWTGKSDHGYWQTSPQGPLQTLPGRNVSLNGGSCVPDCSAYGPDYYWNGYECTDVASPIVIATNPGQYRLTSAADGVQFDIDGDGNVEQIAWTQPNADVAFLALDVDGDGLITSGKELFGDNTLPGVKNGFEALAALARASNGGVVRGSVSEDDPIYFDLLLWTDRNHNGMSEAEELRPAREVVSAIGLGYQVVARKDRHGNVFRYQGWSHVRTSHGRNRADSPGEDQDRRRIIWDVFLTREP